MERFSIVVDLDNFQSTVRDTGLHAAGLIESMINALHFSRPEYIYDFIEEVIIAERDLVNLSDIIRLRGSLERHFVILRAQVFNLYKNMNLMTTLSAYDLAEIRLVAGNSVAMDMYPKEGTVSPLSHKQWLTPGFSNPGIPVIKIPRRKV